MHELVASPSEPSATPQLDHNDDFVQRHLGSNPREIAEMLATLRESSLDDFVDSAIPKKIRIERALDLPEGCRERDALEELALIAAKNRVWKSYIGQGYHDCVTPAVIQRNILENPGWYTAYTPYQAEIAQGRLEALINFQQMIIDLTALDIANASLLDEATAAAEAMHMAHARHSNRHTIFISRGCHPQTIAVVQTRADPLGIAVMVGDETNIEFTKDPEIFAVLLQYPDTSGAIRDYSAVIDAAHQAGALVIMAADILALTLLTPPGELGADIAIGSTQRFGVPLGYGGPHAAYIAARDELKRLLPGRLVGVSKDADGKPAYRLALQTREQHIRRDKATSNICTAQVLLAVMASMFAVYHGPDGLRRIAQRIHGATRTLAHALHEAGFTLVNRDFFDTVAIECESAAHRGAIVKRAEEREINLRCSGERGLIVALDETVDAGDITNLMSIFRERGVVFDAASNFTSGSAALPLTWPASLQRRSGFLTHAVFNRHHTETEMLRYIRRLEAKDLSLTTSMIALGSCTMKLNATSEMLPVSWPAFARLHPFAPETQCAGYAELCVGLEKWLAEITGFDAVSLEPNAGSQGEYAGLLVIRKYHESRGERARNVCLIPTSAHGTNPASAIMAGLTVVPVACLRDGDIDLEDLRVKARDHRETLAALMLTYPSTHGVFEEGVMEMCEVVHDCGGLVYMDGANMNAQVGLTSPGRIGADVCHLNLHKTFCIPHGGGGPGMGPIAVTKQLARFLPRKGTGSGEAVGAISAAPRGSASILTIPWMYIRMMGAAGLTEATRIAILHANYVAQRLDPYFPVVFKGRNGRVAHECIVDLRGFKLITAEDVAKRLIDYGFHAPTLSWPVPGTLMIEPTESESKEELDRFCDAMIAIHAEITEIERGDLPKSDNPLKNAPHTATNIAATNWGHPYSRERAAFPAPWLRDHKYWPPVSRIDNVYGDRNLFCACLPVPS
jgi:glycine dehydrogenase